MFFGLQFVLAWRWNWIVTIWAWLVKHTKKIQDKNPTFFSHWSQIWIVDQLIIIFGRGTLWLNPFTVCRFWFLGSPAECYSIQTGLWLLCSYQLIKAFWLRCVKTQPLIWNSVAGGSRTDKQQYITVLHMIPFLTAFINRSWPETFFSPNA